MLWAEFNLEKLRSTLLLFVRDWSDEGKAERDQTYAPLIAELLRLKPPPLCGPLGSGRVLQPSGVRNPMAYYYHTFKIAIPLLPNYYQIQ